MAGGRAPGRQTVTSPEYRDSAGVLVSDWLLATRYCGADYRGEGAAPTITSPFR